LSYNYGTIAALRDLDFSVPRGALYALLGPNGSGKTTLLQILMGLRRARAGRAALFGIDVADLTVPDRARIGYIAEGQSLPGWMRLHELEAYLAPLYDTWDAGLARNLRERFGLDPSRTIRTLSRGEQMKAALLCALAPRPSLLVMDEPFTGMDALVKDELVGGLLESAGSEGWTVLLCSHDIGELELLADWVGFLDRGQMRLSEPMHRLRERFKRVDVMMSNQSSHDSNAIDPEISHASADHTGRVIPLGRSGRRSSFLLTRADEDLAAGALAAHFPDARTDVSDATLREIFVALARTSKASVSVETSP
jgi:ABC-2 type transport system ATP-binding protein